MSANEMSMIQEMLFVWSLSNYVFRLHHFMFRFRWSNCYFTWSFY